MDRTKWAAVGVMCLAVVVVAGVWRRSVSASSDADRQNLQKQIAAGNGGPGGQMVDNMARELGLNETQKTKMQSVMEKMMPKMRAIFEDTKLSQQDKRTQAEKLRTESQNEIKAILSPEQQKKMDEMEKQMRQRTPPGGMGRGGPGGMMPPPGGMMPPGGTPPGGMMPPPGMGGQGGMMPPVGGMPPGPNAAGGTTQ